jgi:hypothetical protein
VPRPPASHEPMRAFTFRLPACLFEDLAAAARSRGVDVAALLNTVLAAARPALLRERVEAQAALLAAAASRAWGGRPSDAEALRELGEVLRRLQDEHAALSKRVLDDARRAA